jgi:hypothetical protein
MLAFIVQLATANPELTGNVILGAGSFAMWLRLEHRLTRLETKLELKDKAEED